MRKFFSLVCIFLITISSCNKENFNSTDLTDQSTQSTKTEFTTQDTTEQAHVETTQDATIKRIKGLEEVTSLLEPYSIYLIGEAHGNSKTYEAELELIKYFYLNHNVHHFMLEIGYCDGQLLNEYIQTGNERILDERMTAFKGTSAYTLDKRKFYEGLYDFYKSLPEDDKFTLYGVDVQHEYSTGLYYIKSLLEENAPQEIKNAINKISNYSGNNNRKDLLKEQKGILEELEEYIHSENELFENYFADNYSNFYEAVQSLIQGITFYSTDDGEYREQCFTDNFFRIYDNLNEKCLGIWGRWHTNLVGWDEDGYNNVAKNISDQVGDKVTSIGFTYSNSYYYSNGSDYPLETEEGIILGNRSTEDVEFFVLDPDDSEDSIREFAKGHPFAVSIKNSPAAERYK